MEGLVGIIVGFVACIAIIITLIIAVCCYETANARLRRENRRLRQTLEDYYRLEQASMDAYTALAWEAQRQIGGRQS